MQTVSEMLAQLNARRVNEGKKPLKAWKESRAKLAAILRGDLLNPIVNSKVDELTQLQADRAVAVGAEADALDEEIEAFIKANGVTKCPPPKAIVEEQKRRERVEEIAASRTEKPVADKIREAKIVRKPASSKIDGVTLVSIAHELGINDKIARAKMRRVSVPSDFLVSGQKHTYHPQHKQWVIDVLKRDMRKEPRKA